MVKVGLGPGGQGTLPPLPFKCSGCFWALSRCYTQVSSKRPSVAILPREWACAHTHKPPTNLQFDEHTGGGVGSLHAAIHSRGTGKSLQLLFMAGEQGRGALGLQLQWQWRLWWLGWGRYPVRLPLGFCFLLQKWRPKWLSA